MSSLQSTMWGTDDDNININLSKEEKGEFLELCDILCLSAEEAIRIFINKAISERAIPFQIKLREDPFFSKSNQEYLAKLAEEDRKAGYL